MNIRHSRLVVDKGWHMQITLKLLAEIKADDDLQGIPVVVLTASTAEEDIETSERLQVESYLTKPVDLDKFLALVQNLEQFWHADMILPTV